MELQGEEAGAATMALGRGVDWAASKPNLLKNASTPTLELSSPMSAD
jgi:hypothetical protein